ncbi:MAG: alpha/beta hydrolase [Desulfobacteraceae bacterium]|nr:alpha/beta hydrolase [Desulfobacteraceae bacterium]MBC2755759.1 alpha/beta hydrolase [Desulfobacteraceae bacterium]
MSKEADLSVLDRPEILNFLFHPRKESGRPVPSFAIIQDIETDDGIHIGARLYLTDPDMPHILFFHGNGEIAEDYDDIGSIYMNYGLNFLVVDYRGYGRSNGLPGISSMFSDAHYVFNHFSGWMAQNQRKGPLWIMGRSLGSASAIELAASYPEIIKGLIIESGFAHTLPLLERLGIQTETLNIEDSQVFSNAGKLTRFVGPTLILHGQYDQIIPLHHGHDLFEHSPASQKKLHVINGADHNTLLMIGGKTYFEIIKIFIDQSMNS